jgi:hypothetical protein
MSARISPAATARSNRAATDFVRLECIGVEFRRAVHSQRQRPRHALFCSDELDIGAQPATQGFDRECLTLQLFGNVAELFHLAAIDGLKQGFAGREVTVQRPDADSGSSCHGFEARLWAACAEDGFRTSRRRSRLRTASVRGFRAVAVA